MSKIGKKPIHVPQGVTVLINAQKAPFYDVSVTGPKGSLVQNIRSAITVKQENENILIENKRPEDGALQGLYRSLLDNMVKGVTVGWNKGLELKGVGYRASVSGDKLILSIGFSQPVEFPIPKDVAITIVENKINVSGIDKQRVGEVASKIRSFRPPEPYKGKGIRYVGEVVRKKAGKQAVKAGGGA